MDIWKILVDYGKDRNGKSFKTNQLGTVNYKKSEGGELTGVIPMDLQAEANKHGIVIEAALFKEGTYLLRVDNGVKNRL